MHTAMQSVFVLALALSATAADARKQPPTGRPDEPAGESVQPDEPKVKGIDRQDMARERAREHNSRAKKLFNLGLFEQAAEEYEKGYRAKPAPAFLFNLAQCHKRIPHRANVEKAIFYFKSFLNNSPDSPMRGDIDGEIAKLRRELAAIRQRETPPPSRPFYKRWWFWTAVGVATVGVITVSAVALSADKAPTGNLSPGQLQLE